MDLLRKKKVRVALIAVVIWAGARFGLDLDEAALEQLLDLAMVLVAAIGLEDLGKARVVEAVKAGGAIASVEVTTIPPPVAPGPGREPPPLPLAPSRRSSPTPDTVPLARRPAGVLDPP